MAARFWRFAVFVIAAMAISAPPARAQSIIQQLVSPGALTAKHAKFETKCESCHASFDKNAQSSLCLDCHKEIAADVNARRGYHGRIQPVNRPCSVCHTDHEGRDKNIVVFDPKAFDHRQTDYPLRDKHESVQCASCHVQGKTYKEAPSECESCHRKDDPHKAQLGVQCQGCHNEADWKQVKFDHAKTDFPLTGAHIKTKCADCHEDQHYKDVPTTCVSCHRVDDPHKAQLGPQCQNCHNDADWKQVKFDHSKTKFALSGKHQTAKCESCHAEQRYANVATACVSCHRKDDIHKDRLGENCGACHTAANWNVRQFDHKTTKFPLLGKHIDVKCESCHVQSAAKVRLALDCQSCHQKDDTHKGGFGVNCEQCHTANTWKTASFDHSKGTRFALTGKHQAAKCTDCHEVGARTAKIETTCISCHQKDDEHAKQLGANCQQCHGDRGWKVDVRFDHDLSRFPLIGEHGKAMCDACHTSKRYKEAPLPCADCHKEKDVHKAAFGTRCGDCHNPILWADWTFSHDTQTKFPLAGAHSDVKCVACHLPGRQQTPTICIDCHRPDDVHNGRFGTDCGRCHTATSFKALRNRF